MRFDLRAAGMKNLPKEKNPFGGAHLHPSSLINDAQEWQQPAMAARQFH